MIPEAFRQKAEVHASVAEALDYILDMIEQLAKLAAQHGRDDIANHLQAVCEEARRISAERMN